MKNEQEKLKEIEKITCLYTAMKAHNRFKNKEDEEKFVNKSISDIKTILMIET